MLEIKSYRKEVVKKIGRGLGISYMFLMLSPLLAYFVFIFIAHLFVFHFITLVLAVVELPFIGMRWVVAFIKNKPPAPKTLWIKRWFSFGEWIGEQVYEFFEYHF
jgi:hypothetical protein